MNDSLKINTTMILAVESPSPFYPLIDRVLKVCHWSPPMTSLLWQPWDSPEQFLHVRYRLHLQGITSWYSCCSAEDVETAQRIMGTRLSAIQDIYSKRCLGKAELKRVL